MEPRTSRKKRNKWLRRTLYGLLSVAVMVIAYAGYQAYTIYNALDNFEKDESESRFQSVADKTVETPPEWEGKERVNILLLGGDARGLAQGEVARSDSMIVVSIDPVTKRAHLLSILRDTYIDIPGHGKGRANTAITLGGPNLAMKTIGELLGLDIHYYAYADFEGFKALVDAIGGVYFEVEKDMNYVDNADKNRYDIHLKKGYQLLDGDKALQYVRFRHDAMSDFTRTERQREFLKAVAAKLQSTWNIVRMGQILESVQPYIETNLKVSDMLKLGQLGLKLHVAGSAQVPPMELLRDERVGGASVLAIRDREALKAYVQEVLASDETAADTGGDEEDGASGKPTGPVTSKPAEAADPAA
jgi:cell envelope-related function transcriptional attenuator common domain